MKHYTLVFNTTTGSRRSMRLVGPNPDVPTDTLRAAMDQMIANDIFDYSRGGLESINRLEMTRVEHDVII